MTSKIVSIVSLYFHIPENPKELLIKIRDQNQYFLRWQVIDYILVFLFVIFGFKSIISGLEWTYIERHIVQIGSFTNPFS